MEKGLVREKATSKDRFIQGRLPSADAVYNLNRTRELFRSNLLRLQIEELLKETKVDVNQSFSSKRVVQLISEAIAESAPRTIKISSCLRNDSHFLDFVPPELREQFANYRLSYSAPSLITTVGLHALGILVRPDSVVDIVVVMPDSAFMQKDFLDYRYFVKRAVYAHALSRVLKKALKKWLTACEYVRSGGNDITPGLCLRFGDISDILKKDEPIFTRFTYNVVPVVSSQRFDLAKLRFARGNIRVAGAGGNRMPTPYYNNAVSVDMGLVAFQNYMNKVLGSSGALVDGIALLVIWMRCRYTKTFQNRWSVFLMQVWVALLKVTGALNDQMSSYQVVRVALQRLGSANLGDPSLALSFVRADALPAAADKSEREGMFEYTLLDPSGSFNLWQDLDHGSVAEIQADAASSFALLDSGSGLAFSPLFLSNSAICAKYDLIVDATVKMSERSECRASGTAAGEHIARCVAQVVRDGLGDRQRWVRVEVVGEEGDSARVAVHVMLDSETAWKLVTKGPSADEKDKVAAFDRLWKKRAETRHFRDGSMVRCVFFDTTHRDRYRIPADICVHLLESHFAAKCKVFGTGVEDLIAPSNLVSSVVSSQTELIGFLGNIDLPLTISRVQPVSAYSRGTDPFPPRPLRLLGGSAASSFSRLVCPIDLILEFAPSAAWPNEIRALQASKIHFSLKIAELLKQKYGLDSQVSSTDVTVFKDGFAFRISIYTHKEGALVGKETAALLRVDFEKAPALHFQLDSLRAKMPLFGPTARLCKRWLNSHLFGNHFSDMAVDLMVARLFLHPHPDQPPQSAIGGLSSFLQFLIRHDYEHSSIVVDFDSSPAKLARSGDDSDEPFKYLSVVTNEDATGKCFTGSGPSPAVWTRVVEYAKTALSVLEAVARGEGDVACSVVFATNVGWLDETLNLDVAYLRSDVELFPAQSRDQAAKRGSFFSVSATQGMSARLKALLNKADVICDDLPMQFIAAIQSEFKDYVDVFYDKFGGSLVGLKWKEDVEKEQRFRVGHSSYMRPSTSGNVVIDKKLVLERITELGGGLMTTSGR